MVGYPLGLNRNQHNPPPYFNLSLLEIRKPHAMHLSVSKQVLLSLFRQQLYKCCQLIVCCLSNCLCMFSYQITSNQIQIMPLFYTEINALHYKVF
nr:MAG TPA: hypothetical protein [Crassvirales sp.]